MRLVKKWELLHFSFPCFIYLYSNVNKLNTNLTVRNLYGPEINIILRFITIRFRNFGILFT